MSADIPPADGDAVSGPVIFEGLDALRAAAGQHLGRSAWLLVSAESVDQFESSVSVAAAGGPAGSSTLPGLPGTGAGTTPGPVPPDLLLALTNRLLPTVVEVRGVSMGVNYGVDDLRFGSPLPPGARVRIGVDLIEVTEVRGGVQTRMRVIVEAAGQSEPACTVEALSRYLA